MSRSRRQKKSFACGHRGFGQWCHACATQEPVSQTAKASRDRQQRQQWQDTFQADLVDLTHLPKRIVLMARRKIDFLAAGGAYRQLGGKRLQSNRSILSIPVTRHYRLWCRITLNQITPTQVLSHEAYNAIARNTRR